MLREYRMKILVIDSGIGLQHAIRMKEEGDVGTYKKMVEQLFNILDKIMKKTEAIDRAVVTLTNANRSIKEEVSKGKRI